MKTKHKILAFLTLLLLGNAVCKAQEDSTYKVITMADTEYIKYIRQDYHKKGVSDTLFLIFKETGIKLKLEDFSLANVSPSGIYAITIKLNYSRLDTITYVRVYNKKGELLNTYNVKAAYGVAIADDGRFAVFGFVPYGGNVPTHSILNFYSMRGNLISEFNEIVLSLSNGNFSKNGKWFAVLYKKDLDSEYNRKLALFNTDFYLMDLVEVHGNYATTGLYINFISTNQLIIDDRYFHNKTFFEFDNIGKNLKFIKNEKY